MLRRIGWLVLSALALVYFSGAPLLAQQQTEPRIAFVVGNAGYGAGGAADRAQTTRDSSPRRCAASALKSSKARI